MYFVKDDKSKDNADLNLLRINRDQLLADTDWAGMSDNVITEDMRIYRQELRDLPATYADNPESVVYPKPPQGVKLCNAT
jgi:hypothetical protein